MDCLVIFLFEIIAFATQGVSQIGPSHTHHVSTIDFNLQQKSVTAFGWLSLYFDDSWNIHFAEKDGGYGPPVEFFAFLLDVLLVILLILSRCCGDCFENCCNSCCDCFGDCGDCCCDCCDDCCNYDSLDCCNFEDKYSKQKTQWTARRKWTVFFGAVGAILKFGGCLWYMIRAQDSQLYWCAVQSSASLLFNLVALCAMMCHSKKKMKW